MASAGSIRWRREEFGWITLDYSSSKLLLLRVGELLRVDGLLLLR